MNVVFQEQLRKMVLVFFDDILVYSKIWDKHLEHVCMVLEILRRNQLYVKLSKCEFGKTELRFLGHVVNRKGVAMDPSKVEDII